MAWVHDTSSVLVGRRVERHASWEISANEHDTPELIDAAFVNLTQYYKGKEGELRNRTIIAQKIPFDEQMTYRAIIDINGNNWSSRFAGLLCTNSVVIKVRNILCLGALFRIIWYLCNFSWPY